MQTDTRGLVFEICSLAAGDDTFYEPASISATEYYDAVHALYEPQIEPLVDNLVDEKGSLIFKDSSELHDICIELETIDDIYKQELNYHDAKWLKQFPVKIITLSRRDNPTDAKGDFSYGVKIDGTIKASELEQFISDLYTERTGKTLN